MEVQINSCPVEVKLEGEEKAKEIIDSIVEWSRERHLICIEAYIDDKIFMIDQVPDIAIGDISLINCIVKSESDICIASLKEGIEYCNKVYSFVSNAIESKSIKNSELDDLGNGIEWIIEVAYKSLQLLSLKAEEVNFKDKSINEYVYSLNQFSKLVKNEKDTDSLLVHFKDNLDIFRSFIDIFKMLLLSENMKMLIIESIDSPDVLIDSLINIKNEISNQIDNLEETAIAFQSGKDDAGSEKLQLFIDFIYRYIRTCHQIAPVFEIDLSEISVDDITLEDKNNEIQDLLNEIVDVMENNDIISLSDILEYEIKASLENLDQYIDAIIDYSEQKV